MAEARVIIVESPLELASRVAELFVSTASESVGSRGMFLAAISGGSTPRQAHRLLASPALSGAVPWERTHLFWVDERCVSIENPLSNFGCAWGDFLKNVPVPAVNLHRVRGEIGAEVGAEEYRKEMTRFFDLKAGAFPCFDLVLLGLGADGHTASLFPGDAALREESSPTAAVRGIPFDMDRVTMTLPVLNAARRVAFLVAGRQKAEALKRVLSGESPPLPAAMVKPLSGELLYFVDRGAAALIQRGQTIEIRRESYD